MPIFAVNRTVMSDERSYELNLSQLYLISVEDEYHTVNLFLCF